jgi:hypothetical protein
MAHLLYNIGLAIGVIKLFQLALFACLFIKRHLSSVPNLYRRYSKQQGSTWAVVTGASDGMGAEYCYQLAK